ncbi:20236_t:CDS:2 [Dentiscutata erythropus]|uniref:20236_t:CDS:1 n=1 Tax=Dentiscutata erythropus TaxID=1348616 RepID=A0A9N9G0A4_9GLOM|nr:20236_t:CDS:2 [Dentiscutata erythropus]
MSTKKPQESIVNIEDEGGKVKERYLAISPNGDFVVEFVLLSSESKLWDLQLCMYNVEDSKKNKDLDKIKDELDQIKDGLNQKKEELNQKKDDLNQKKVYTYQKIGLSYRNLSENTASINKFTKEQSDLINYLNESRNKLSWSVAVSDRLKLRKSTVRLLAISYNSIGEEILRLDKYGGIVKLFSKNEVDKKTDKDGQNTDKNTNEDNYQTINKYFLIILNVSGIYKHHLEHLNKPTCKIQSLKHYFEQLYKHTNKFQSFYYPKRIDKAFEYNGFSAEFNMKYIIRCLTKHYFLVDTTNEGAQYMELYDLKTNQLVNTFKRRNLNSLKNYILDISDNFAISHNNKLLAYKSGNQVKLYLTECGLEIASINLEDGKSVYDYFMHFFNNDERLFIYQSKNKWTIWDIFGSVQKSIKLENQLDLDLKILGILNATNYRLERSDSIIIVFKNKEEKEFSEDKQIYVYDDLISDYACLNRKSDKHDLTTLPLDKSFTDTGNNKLFIFDLDNHKSELDGYYYIIEPWVHWLEKGAPRYSVYLDKEKEVLLLIGWDTIQVWYDRAKDKNDQAKKRTLEFISVIDNDGVKKIEYSIKKFKITKDSQLVIEMRDDDDLIFAVIEACHTLKFLKKQADEVDYFSLSDEDRYSKFQMIIKQTRNIIVRFIQLYPTTWRLLDVRYDLLSILNEAEEYLLIKYVLFKEEKDIDSSKKCILKTLDYLVSKFEKNEKNEHSHIKLDQDILLHEESLRMPQKSSWEDKGKAKNTINKALEGYLLEYYSNKAVEDIRWMITVDEILPKLYKKNKNGNRNGNKNEFYKSYQLLFYKRCFCEKELDIPFFDFFAIPPSTDDSLEVFIPITQLIPQDSVLKVEEISHDKAPDVKMVPLIDFVTNDKKFIGNKFVHYLKSLILPNKYLPQRECSIPFISLIDNVAYDHNDPFYFNPSIEAIMNFMWYSSKPHWLKSLVIFIIYFLSYSIISWMYIAHFQVTDDFQKILLLFTIMLFFYLAYHHLIVEFNQVFYKTLKKYYSDPFNWVDLFALLLPVSISVILIRYYTFDNGFKYAKSSLNLAFLIFISILGIWYEFGHALFLFLGYASYIGLSESSETFEVLNGSNIVYNMTEEEPEDIFTNPLNSIIAAYNWGSISLDDWGFWPLLIISVIGNIAFVIILQNVIISFMSAAFENADKNGKRVILTFQSRLIYDYVNLENSAFTSGMNYFDTRLKDKLRVKYICFYNEPLIRKAWRDESKEWESSPIYSNVEGKMQIEDESELFIEEEDINFIWTSAEKKSGETTE